MTGSSDLRDQLLRAFSGTVVLRVVSLASTFVGSVVLARALGASAFGTYSFVFAITTLLALPAQVGIPTLLVRETAKAQVEKEWGRLKGLWAWASKIILVTSLGISLLAILVVWSLSDVLSSETRVALFAGILLVPLVALGNARSAALRGLRLIVRGQLPDSVIRPLLLVLFVFASWRLSGEVSASAAMYWHVGAATVAFVIGTVMLWRARPHEVAVATSDLSMSVSWRRAAVPLALISGLQVVSNQIGLVLLGMLGPQEDVAYFKVAVSAAALMTFGLQVTNLIVSPHVARLHELKDSRRLAKLAGLGALGGTIISLPLFLIFAIAGERLLSMIYGSEYSGAFVPLVVLAGAQLVNTAFGSTGVLLNMTGHEKIAAKWLAVAALVNVILAVALIPSFGISGAAWASATSVILWNLAFWVSAKRALGVDGSVFSLLGYQKIEAA